MIINFDEIEEKVTPNFHGGDGEMKAHIFVDNNNKILVGKLEPGSSIGVHCHENNSETIYITKGRGKVAYNDEFEFVSEGVCHYCPLGHSHGLINDSNEDLHFFAIVSEHNK
ncbi:MAG: cupin domain-containing protein [Anaerovoracaceae bacterium]